MAQAQRQPWTRTNFLAWEEQQDERWEFVDGIVRQMAGGTVRHNVISGNVFVTLQLALRGGACRAFQQNMKLTPAGNEDSMYPDVFVACGALEETQPTVDTATVVVEVVSKSSREDDYSRKWDSYQGIPELRHYLVIEQDTAKVVAFSRASEKDEWRFRPVQGLDGSIELSAVGVTLRMADIYAGTTVSSRS